MKIVITGSLGHIGKPLTQELMKKGHAVVVISSKGEKQKEIESLGATAAIGSIDDVDFLTKTFMGSDEVYTMLPPFKFMENLNLDARAEANRLSTNYVNAIKASGVKKVVHLSSVGAHLEKGNGLLAFHFVAEQIMNTLPAGIAITFMRPVGFYYNLYEFMDIIKGKGFLEGFLGKIMTLRYYGLAALIQGKKGLILSNYGGKDMIPWVSPKDIAMAIADELSTIFNGRKIRYVASEELTGYELATVLGDEIGKPYLKWEVISDKQMLSGLKQFKIPDALAHDITEMNAGMHSGLVYEDYYKYKPVMGKVKIRDFAKEFAEAYKK